MSEFRLEDKESFRSYLRMNTETFDELARLVQPYIHKDKYPKQQRERQNNTHTRALGRNQTKYINSNVSLIIKTILVKRIPFEAFVFVERKVERK